MLADRIIVTTGGDHTSVEVIVGLIHTYWRDMQCSNNSVMVLFHMPLGEKIGGDLKCEWRLMYHIYVENNLRRHRTQNHHHNTLTAIICLGYPLSMSNRVTSEIGSRRARENLVRILFQHLKKDQFDDRLQRRRHSYSQLRAAYIDLVHSIHPDKLAPFHDDEERTRRQECQQKFVELQTAWEQYHASVREVLRERQRYVDVRSRMSGDNKNDDDGTFDDDSSFAIDDANFTMFGVGCSFADTPDERDRRDKIMEQASREWRANVVTM